jgi:GxxExxY protein
MNDEFDPLTEKIIGCAFTVSNGLGIGFLEKVYENALAHEMRKQSLLVEQQKQVSVVYDGVVVGEYQADLVVGKRVIVELKVAKGLDDVHMAQCLNYLKATGLKTVLLLNFGTAKLGIKRISLEPPMDADELR